MGFFDFIGDAGKALFGGGEPSSAEEHAEALKTELDSHALGTLEAVLSMAAPPSETAMGAE